MATFQVQMVNFESDEENQEVRVAASSHPYILARRVLDVLEENFSTYTLVHAALVKVKKTDEEHTLIFSALDAEETLVTGHAVRI